MDFKVKKTCQSCSQLYSTKATTPQKSRLPLMLSCGHPVCEACIRNILRFTEPVQCKVCSRDMEITQSEMIMSKTDLYSVFPINVYMVGELTLQEMHTRSADSVAGDKDYYIDLRSILRKLDGTEGRCVECSAVTTKMCAQCITVLCENCFHKTHKFHVFKSHVLKLIELDLGSNLCKLHKDRPLDYYCHNCHKSVCMDCMMVGGDKSCKSHNVVSAEEMNKEVIEELNGITLQVDEQFRRLTKTAVDIGHLLKNQDTGNSNTDVDKMRETIQNHFAKLHASVQRHENEIMHMLENLSLAEAQSLDKSKATVAENIKKAKAVMNKITHAVSKDNSSKINLHAVLEEAKDIVNSPWYLSKDTEKEENSLKLSVNEDVCALVTDYVHLEGNTAAGYRLLRAADIGGEVPPPPPKPVYPPELVKDVRHAARPKPPAEGRRPEPFVTSVPQYRSRHGGSTHSVNSLGSTASSKGECASPMVQHVPPFPESRPPKPLREGSQELIYVSHIIDPQNFYVQRACHQDLVKDMIREFRNGACLPKPAASHVCEGKVYLALNKAYREWQRCRVLSVDRGDADRPAYTVFCVDFGSTETVAANELRLCPAARLQSPAPLAIHCSLANVAPRPGGWTTEDAMLVQKIIDNKQAVLHVRRVRGAGAAGATTLECDVTTLQDGTSLAHALAFHERCDLVDAALEYPLIPELSERPRLFFSTGDYRTAAVVEVLVTHVVSPDKFYVRKCHLQQTYEKLCEDLDNEYSLSDMTGTVYLPEKGMVVIANLDACLQQAPAGGWRRGVVLDTVRRRARLLLADTGETALVHYTSLRACRPPHVQLKALATECHLSGVTPLNKKWSRGSVALLERYTGRPLELHVEENKFSKNGSVGVTLYDKSDPYDVVCINTEMIRHKFAVTIGVFQFNKNISAEQLVYSRTPLDQPRAPRPPPKQKIQILKRDQELPATPKKVKDTDLKAKDKGPIKLEVKILSCQSPSLIYVALIDQQKTFKELFDQLQAYYTKVKPEGKDKAEWKVGDSCCTVCEETKTWRRAVVVEIMNDLVKVFYTDFACVEKVPIAYLRDLPEEFSNIGDAAIKCHLSGVIPAIGDEWPSLTKEYLSELVEAYHRIFITKNGAIKDNSLPVELWVYHVIQGEALEPNKAEWRCLNRNIIEQGLGVPDKSQHDESAGKQLTEDTITLLSVTASVRDWVRLEAHAAGAAAEPTSRSPSPQGGGARVLPVADWLPPEPLPAAEFTAEPTYVDNSAVIYLHNIEQNGTLELIRKALDVRFKDPDRRAMHAHWAVGQPCVARFYLDGLFYRGRVLEVNQESKKCIVHYIDYGNEESCSFADMRDNIVLYQIPTQAHRCRLDRIRPAGGTWNKNSLDYIHKAIVEKQVFVKVSGAADDVGVIPIELKFDKLWINDHLVDFDMARYTDGSKPVVAQYLPPAARAPLTDTDSDPDFIVETTDADTTQEECDDEGVFSRAPGECVDSNMTSYAGVHGCSWSDFKDWNKVMEEDGLPPKYPMFVQDDEVAGEFVCNITCVQDTCAEVTRAGGDAARYDAMFAELQAAGDGAPPLEGMYENKACLAKFTEDKRWYRASILQYSNERGLVNVRYVDFGNSEVVDLSDVREINEQYLELPPASISCQLHNVKLNPEVDMSKFVEDFEKTFLNKGTFKACVMKKDDGKLFVELRNDEGDLIYQNLIEQAVFLPVEDLA